MRVEVAAVVLDFSRLENFLVDLVLDVSVTVEISTLIFLFVYLYLI